MTIQTRKKSRDEIHYWQELRRSNAASPHANKSKYKRKPKHKGKQFDSDNERA